MATFDTICECCRNLDLNQGPPSEGYPLHHNVVELEDCGKTCGLCRAAYDQFSRRLPIQAVQYSCRPDDWEVRLFHVQYSVSVLDYTGIKALEVPGHQIEIYDYRHGVLYLVLSKSESLFTNSWLECTHKDSIPTPLPRVSFRPWMYASLMQDIGSGLQLPNTSPWLKKLPRLFSLPHNTSSPASIDKARTWLRECIKADAKQSHRNNTYDGLEIQKPSPQVNKLSRLFSLPYNTSSRASIDRARTWLRKCIKADAMQGHRSNTYTEILQDDYPSRLIHITGSDVFSLALVDGKSSTDGYSALSYCWGEGPATWRTLRTNLKDRYRVLSMQDLPPTLQQAVEVTSRLGLHYLWVDSICIAQDDSQEWESEAVKMASIYKNATLTIAADWAPCAGAGLYNSHSRSLELERSLREGHVNAILPCIYEKASVYLSTSHMFATADHVFETSNLARRAWAYQERLLSRRILHFTETQLYWECVHAFRSEDNFVDDTREGFNDLRTRLLPSGNHSVNTFVDLWYTGAISEYSGRRLTKQKDRLLAVAGVAKAAKPIFQIDYHAGHWNHQFVGSLCWWTVSSAGKIATFCAPTWSWASQVGQIYWDSAMNRTEYAQLLAIHTETQLRDEFGLVTNGWIALEAHTLDAQLIRDDQPNAFHPQGNRVRVCPDSQTFLPALLDDQAQIDNDVRVCLIMQCKTRRRRTLYFLLLSELTAAPGQFVRIGLSVCNSRKEDVLQMFLNAAKRKFVVV